MFRLILMRHAKAVREHEAPNDHARSLTERGQVDAALMAHQLADLGYLPDLVLLSSATRTRETFLVSAPILGRPHVRVQEGLYLANDRHIAGAIEAASHVDCLMVIGHNPGLHDLACDLVRKGRTITPAGRKLLEHLPTSGIAVFEEADSDQPVLVANLAPEKP